MLKSALCGLRAQPWVGQALSELSQLDGCMEAADSLSLALSGGPDAYAAASAAHETLWRLAVESASGWTAPCCREAFVLAACAAVAALGDDSDTEQATKQQRLIDTAFIMGGPQELLSPFLVAVEPRARAALDVATVTPFALPPPPSPSPPAVSLPSLAQPTAAQFKSFFIRDEACVLTGALCGWPALDKWQEAGWWVRTHGHRFVPLEVGSHADPGWHESVVTLASFVRQLQSSPVPLYLAQHTLFEQCPALAADIGVPDVIRNRVTRTNIWFGSGGTVSPLHFDSYDTLLCQVVGYKKLRLFDSSQTPMLYRTRAPWTTQRRWPKEEERISDVSSVERAGSRAALGTVSLVDVETPDLKSFPLFAQAVFKECVLGPGDCVYIPSRCWHWVKSCSVSISVSCACLS